MLTPTNDLNFLVYLSPLTTALVVVVWYLIRTQIKAFVKVLDSKVSLVEVEKILAEKIKASETWSGGTFVLSKLFEQYAMEAKDTMKELNKFILDSRKENYDEHSAIKLEISRNRDTVLKEINDGFAGIRTELTNIRKVASDSMLELARERSRTGSINVTTGSKE